MPTGPAEGTTWEAWVASLVKTTDLPAQAAAQPAPPVAQAPSEPRVTSREEPRSEERKPEAATPRQAEITPLPLRPRRPEPTLVEEDDELDAADPVDPEPWRPPIWTPPADRSSTAALPPRLRQKLEQGDERKPTSNRGLKWTLLVGIIALIAIAATLLMRFAPWGKGSPRSNAVARHEPAASSTKAPLATAGPPTAATPAITLPSTTTEGAPATTKIVPPPASSTAPPVASSGTPLPATKGAPSPRSAPAVPAKTLAKPATVKPATAPKPAAEQNRFSLSVATFLNEDRAKEERGRLASSTGLAARVVPVHQDDDSVSSYSIVIGAYTSRDAAERAASNLIQRGLVDEARVVSAGAVAPKR